MSEQRLINANELPVSSIDAVDVDKYIAKYGTGIPVVLLSDIEHALTIEERKTGKWVDKGGYIECSNCGCLAPSIECADNVLWKKSSFCPDCGAKMQEGEDDG